MVFKITTRLLWHLGIRSIVICEDVLPDDDCNGVGRKRSHKHFNVYRRVFERHSWNLKQDPRKVVHRNRRGNRERLGVGVREEGTTYSTVGRSWWRLLISSLRRRSVTSRTFWKCLSTFKITKERKTGYALYWWWCVKNFNFYIFFFVLFCYLYRCLCFVRGQGIEQYDRFVFKK